MNSKATADSRSPRRARRGLRLPRTRWRKWLFLTTYALFLLALPMVGIKFYWRVRSGVPLNETAKVWDYYYPELRTTGALSATLATGDGQFNVLLLGGSVLEPAWGDVERVLNDKLATQLPGKYRVFNLGRSAHMSRDSWLKYRQLAGRHFDLVIVYDGINDVRMNNCPAEMFRDDYTHCAWYRSLEQRVAAGKISLPSLIGQQMTTIAETISRGGGDSDEYREMGREIKTTGAFRQNLTQIVDTARERSEHVILMTYAWHLPADYTADRFRSRDLDYSFREDGRSCGAEMWGLPAAVRAGLDAHNGAIRDLAALNPEVAFVDQESLLVKDGTNFVDPCHLTATGSQRFVENLWPTIEKHIRAWNDANQAGR